MSNLFLQPINWGSFGIVVAIVAVLAILFGALIVLISKLCAVKENEKISAIQDKLAGANCGGCGFAGCADFAKAVVSACGPTPNQNKKEISEILGIPFNETEQAYAVVKCSGGELSEDIYEYIGNKGCIQQAIYMDGKKKCPSGCMGGGTCVSLCPYHAVKIVNGVAVVDKALCEACGLCVRNCPHSLIELIPTSSKVYVACSTTCKGKEVTSACKAGCIGCGICAKVCPEGAITIVNNLPVIDYKKCTGCLTCVSKCPRKVIKEI